MLSFFNNNQIRANIGLLLLFVLINCGTYLHASMPPSPEAGLFALFFEPISSSAFLSLFFGSVILLANALLINRIYNRHGFGNREHVLPALFFLLLSSAFPDLLYFNSLTTALFFFLISFHFLLTLYSEVLNTSQKLFQTGLFLGLSFLFFPVLIFILPWSVISILILRKMSFRNWLVWIFGFIPPLWLTFSILYLSDRSEVFWHSFDMLRNAPLLYLDIPANNEIFLISGFFVLLVLAVIHEIRKQSTITMQRRKVHTILMLLYPFLIATMNFSAPNISWELYPVFIPLSFSAAYLYEDQWRTLYLRILFYSLLILILSHQYLNFDLINYIIP